MSREEFLPVLAVFVAAVLGGAILDHLFPGGPFTFGQVPTLLPLMGVAAANRLRDMDHTGWWVLALPAIWVGVLLLSLVLLAILGPDDPLGSSLPQVAITSLQWLVMPVLAAGLLGWCCMPGTPGPNRFGPRPGKSEG